jgi:hypothetical protein
MDVLTKFLEANRTLSFVGPFLWILLVIAASIAYRRSRGKVILTSKPKDSLFYEGWASGRSNKNFFTKLGGANNCLMVAVTPDCLIVQLRFPFNLMFLPEITGLEYHIPRLNIRYVEAKAGIFGKSAEIQFIDVNGSEQSVKLYVRKMEEFLSAIGKISDTVGNKSGL